MKVKNKNIVVTGGGNGVGRELVISLLSKGARVIAVDISKESLEETTRLSGNNNNLSIHRVDISNKEEVLRFADEILNKYHKVDGIINNAGIIQPFVNLSDLDYDRIDRVMNVNFYGTLYMTKAFLPSLLKQPEAHIVNIASMGGFLPVPGQSIYGASKAAVKIMTEGLYSELMKTNVNVTVVFPGGVATDIKKNSNLIESKTSTDNHNSKLLLSPDKAANLIINAMEKNKYRVFLGKDCNLMNVLYKLTPVFATRMINRVLGSKAH
jgi:short-subunit dehydrogenase